MACATCCVWAGSQNETVIDGSMVKEGIAPTAPALPENAFVVQLQKGMVKGGNAQHGLVLDLADEDVCIVKEVEGGLAGAWNSTCDESIKIKPFDRIIRVNGVSGSSRELAQILIATRLFLFSRICT
ncbi:unnamed protein product [Symbiodinium natans]|uniref:PDZ domain-containing protein n=1 Tax=Symbiodinium natans TaxID=878477 RepID=A0A812SAQ9_9DINO|nr:unnamed protein product [Symbiodinium natans]